MKPFGKHCLRVYVRFIHVVRSIRRYLKEFRLPGEAQRIDKLMESFAHKYCEDNPGSIFPSTGAYQIAFSDVINVLSTDAAYLLSFSIILLNTDAHSPAIPDKDKMTKAAFVKNNTGILAGGDLPIQFLEEIYDRYI